MPEVEVAAPHLTARVQAWRAAHPEAAELSPEVLEDAVQVARQALLEARPQLVVGSSFGGGLALKLAVEGVWKGPLVLLAPAGERLFGQTPLPAREGRVVVVHGRQDDVIPLAHSVALAHGSACEVVLWLVNDEHRLVRSVEEGVLDRAVQLAVR